MKTLLLLTDFSQEATHAAQYACQLAGQLHTERIILLYVYPSFQPIAQQPLTMMADKDMRQELSGKMEKLKYSLQSMLNPSVDIRFTVAEGALSGLVNFVARQEKAELIVMGTTYKTGMERAFSGSNTVILLEESELPVLVVPPAAPLQELKNIVLATDIKDVENTLPVNEIAKLLDVPGTKLKVLNIDAGDHEVTADMAEEMSSLNSLLQEYTPEYHYLNNDDIIDGIATFADNEEASLVIVLHEQRNFISRMFHESVADKLPLYLHMPLLSVKKKK